MSRSTVISARSRRRLGPLILAFLLFAQLAIDLHKADHTDVLRDTPCPLCVSADHLAGPPPAATIYATTLTVEAPIPVRPRHVTPAPVLLPYESRAPPSVS